MDTVLYVCIAILVVICLLIGLIVWLCKHEK